MTNKEQYFFEATASFDMSEENMDSIMQLLGIEASSIDLTLEFPLGKMPRKIKKGLASAKGTKWHRKAKIYKKKRTFLLKNCEIVDESISDGMFNMELKINRD